ncbi:MAG: MarR family transcriptional regulator [Candidatus Bathyarchaeota archaeon]|nr:MarR family transcriptional regulator [Candidatus Bathyarchaeota archaeon]
MRNHRLAACTVTITLLFTLLALQTVHCQNYFEYTVHIREDGSALWTIRQFSNSDDPVETWEGFQNKVFDLVESAQNLTLRTMSVDETSLQIDSTLSFNSKITVYSFIWEGFCVVQGSDLIFGDVFGVNNFFGKLFGDASMQVSYPEEYTVKSVYPPPLEGQGAGQVIRWPRTHDLAGEVNVVLTLGNGNVSFGGFTFGWSLIAVFVLVSASVSVAGVYLFKRRKGNSKPERIHPEKPSIESEDEKVLRLLRNSGGTMRQSEVTERLGFSKAKTSQLLSALESRGSLARYKKGRDKIVVLKDPVVEKK